VCFLWNVAHVDPNNGSQSARIGSSLAPVIGADGLRGRLILMYQHQDLLSLQKGRRSHAVATYRPHGTMPNPVMGHAIILPTAAFLFVFRTDSTDSPDCLPILLSISVSYFFCFPLFSCWFRAAVD